LHLVVALKLTAICPCAFHPFDKQSSAFKALRRRVAPRLL
jgi:hypothetical protein